jgi:hypothetical protein
VKAVPSLVDRFDPKALAALEGLDFKARYVMEGFLTGFHESPSHGFSVEFSDYRKLVWRYLTNRRGVILLVNRVTPVVSAALRELGFEVVGGAASGQARSQKFQCVLSNHAIFHPFLSPEPNI